MIWIVDKKIVPHILTREGVLAELPLRVSFEYAVESGSVVDGTLSIKVLYNGRSVSRSFPGIETAELDEEVQRTANDAVCEHLALSGLSNARDAASSAVVTAAT